MNILSITPPGEDPLIYWHQLAQDAIHSADKQRERFKQDQERLAVLERNELYAQKKREREQLHQSIPAFRDLLWMVQQGKFSMNVQLSFYPNTDCVNRKEYDDYDD